MQKLFEDHVPKYLNQLNNTLLQEEEFKFICGENITIYDISVAGYFHDVILNPKAKYAEKWAAMMESKCPVRVKYYLKDFGEVFKEYLSNRPESIW